MSHSRRIKTLRSHFADYPIDALLIVKNENIRYLTGFAASESWLFLTSSKSFYITDGRYTLEARQGLKEKAIVIEHKGNLAEKLFELAKQNKIKKIGFDEGHVTLAHYKMIKAKCPAGIKLIPANGTVEKLREIKDKEEIRHIKSALKLHAQTLSYLKRFIRPGVSERDIYLKLEQYVKAKKAEFSFSPIVASGPNSAFPHARITERIIKKNDVVLLDMGIDWQDYTSDLTRMFFLGKIPQLIEEGNTYVAESKRRAIEKIDPGVPVAVADQAARSFLAKKKLDKYFNHSLGHGVGLEIHESPRLSQKSKAVFQEGMIVTVEPAVYLSGKFGIRLEDMVLVTRHGCEILSEYIH